MRAGMSPPEAMKLAGHTQCKTFLHYLRLDDDFLSRAAALDQYLAD
jgi:hypothetical protein